MDPKLAARRRIVVALIILVVFVGIGIAFKKLVFPALEEKRVEETGTKTHYKTNVRIGMDSFSGYAVLRSPHFRDQLGRSEIGVQGIDDKADYTGRMKALQKGDLDMAVFTIDTDIINGTEIKEFPGTILFLIDESFGADGIVAFKSGVASASDLNRADAKIIAKPNSPSETLARHLIANMLPNLASQNWLVKATDMDDVLERMKKADQSEPNAYVLWEPELSKALALEGVVPIYDTSHVSGVIVDVLLVNRKYLQDQSAIVKTVTSSYFRALHFYGTADGGMAKLVMDDAKLNGDTLTDVQAKKIADGIKWKNTMENYAQFGLLSAAELHGLPTMREMIVGISQFLVKTGKLKTNPKEGKETDLYFDEVLKSMNQSNFHPGQTQDEVVRGVANLPELTDAQWKTLLKVGDMDAKSISFARGRAEIEIQGKRDVADVANRLKAWPTYYLSIIGHTRGDGDPAANLALALARAKNVSDELVALGVSPTRIKTSAELLKTQSGTAQSVTFTLSQRPY